MFSIKESVESSYYIYKEVCVGCCSTPSVTIRPLISKKFRKKANKLLTFDFLKNLSIKSDEVRYKNLLNNTLADSDIELRVKILSARCFLSRSPWTTYLLESNITKSELGFLDIDIDVEASKCQVTERIYNKERKVKHVLFRNVIVASAKFILNLFITIGFTLKYLEFVVLKEFGDCDLKHHEFMRLGPFIKNEGDEEVRFTIEVSKLLVMTSIFEEIPKSITLPRINQMKMHLRYGQWPESLIIRCPSPIVLPRLSLIQDGVDRFGEIFKDYFGGRF
jgi:hypothetical protein